MWNAVSVRIRFSTEMFVDANIRRFATAETKMKHCFVSYQAKSSVAPCPQVKPEVGEAFLPSLSPGPIHDEINLLNLTETFRTPCSAATCTCALEVPPALIFFSICRGTWSATSHAYTFFQFLPWLSFSAARLWLSLINVWKLSDSPPTSSNSPALSHSLLSFWHLFSVSLLSRGSRNATHCWGTKIIKVPQKCTKDIPLGRKRRLRFQSEKEQFLDTDAPMHPYLGPLKGPGSWFGRGTLTASGSEFLT